MPRKNEKIKHKKNNGNARFRLPEDEQEIIFEYRRIKEECKEQGIDPVSAKHLWIKSKTSSIFVKNPAYDGEELTPEKVESAIKKIVDRQDIQLIDYTPPKKSNKQAIKLTISDSHIGMNPDDNGLFQYEYNQDIYMQSLNKVFASIKKEHGIHSTFDLMLIDDLGDMADGWNGYTTRGGHELPQNMTNAEVFEICVEGKLQLIRKIINANIAKKVILRCVTNDNHAGDFGLIINLAIKRIINQMYDKKIIEVDILTKFLEHRTYGDHCFILTHGKDKKHMKSGLPLSLNDSASRFLNDYIDHYGINSKYVHVEKGDLHQIGYQKTKRFDYRNFMSFAPPSSWIQHNFGDTYSGYSIQIVPKNNNEISHTDYFLDYKKKN